METKKGWDSPVNWLLRKHSISRLYIGNGTCFPSRRQGEEVRQLILVQAKEACLDLIFLNQQKDLLDIRRENAEQLAVLYQQRLEQGDANILETNKIELELLNVRNEARMNETARVNKLRELPFN